MNKRLLATDLDGTLLNRSGDVSFENWAAIEEMKRRGLYFVPASGRCYSELPEKIRDSEWIRYYILSGGSAIYDKEKDSFTMKSIPKKIKDRVLDTLYRYPTCIMAHVEKNSCVDAALHDAESYASFGMNDFWVRYALEKEKPIENFKSFLYDNDRIGMMVIFFRYMEDLVECREILKRDEDLLVVQTDPYNLEVVSAEAGKGSALLQLASMLGLRREETIAVGDSLNDKTMIEQAGLGLAMANAIPEILAMADEVICDNDSHCVAYILERFCSESEG